MESDSILAPLALAVSLACFAIFSLGEASVASVRRERSQRLASDGVSGWRALETLSDLPMGPDGALSLLRVASLSAAVLSGAALVIEGVGTDWAVVAAVSLAVLLFCGAVHIAAARVASTYGESIALRAGGVVRILAWALNPMLYAQAAVGRKALSKTIRGHDSPAEMAPGDISLPLDSDGEPLDEHEVRMIRGVVQLDKTTAREIMMPRVDMVAVDVDTPISELSEQMIKGGHSRIPVYRGDLDHIEGIAYARDVLRHLVDNAGSGPIPVESVTRPALFIPESKTLEELLTEFQERRVHMAILVDEYGGVSGLVTIEDLLEEIVGEIQDEFDVGEPEIQALGEGDFMMDARVSIDQLDELLGVSVEGDGFDTLGGFVYQRLGRIPSRGDQIEYDGLNIEVMSTVERRLIRLRVTKA